MSAPEPGGHDRERRGHFLYGRRVGPLVGPWIACIIIATLTWWFETKMPAFHDVVRPVYWILLVVLIIVTARALRSRASRRRHGERRHGDRRHRES
jgi:hypothetical protein